MSSIEQFVQNNQRWFDLIPLSQPQNNTISLIIPCHTKHAHLLCNLLKIYSQQTVLPQEVIISLSGIKLIKPEKFKQLKNKLKNVSTQVPFAVRILYHKGRKLPGGNKNKAAQVAVHDLIVVQDADDIPHPQRLEVIKYYFDHFQIIHLMHGLKKRFSNDRINIKTYRQLGFNQKINNIGMGFSYFRHENMWKKMPKSARIYVSNGEIAIRRKFLEHHQWREDLRVGEDTKFNRKIENLYGKSLHIARKLIIYNKVSQI